jgi:hypothetical protein
LEELQFVADDPRLSITLGEGSVNRLLWLFEKAKLKFVVLQSLSRTSVMVGRCNNPLYADD